MYHNHRVALLVDSNERTILKNFYELMKFSVGIDNPHFKRLKKLILIHIDIGAGTPGKN